MEFDSVTTSFHFAASDNNEIAEKATGGASGGLVIEIQKIILTLNGETKRSEIESLFNLKHNDYFRAQYIIPALYYNDIP